MLKDELDFFIANQPELVKQYSGKILVIKNKEVIGVYNNVLEAYLEAQKENELVLQRNVRQLGELLTMTE